VCGRVEKKQSKLTLPFHTHSGNPNSGVPAPHTGVVADALLRAPIVGLLFKAIGCYSASKPSVMRLLARSSVGIIPEGIAGIFHGAKPGRERVFLKARKGFIKAAIQAGVDLVPVYHFHSALLTPVSLVSDATARRLRAAIIWPAGVAGLPVPRASEPVLSAVGDAVRVTQDDNPSAETVDEVHARFVASLQAAFDGHKHLAGPAYAKKELEVV
jgi:diacylglycerol O-acyltransferase 2, plant